MRVEFNISDENKETYAVIYSSSLNDTVKKAAEYLESVCRKKDILPLMIDEKTVFVNTENIYMVRIEDTKPLFIRKKKDFSVKNAFLKYLNICLKILCVFQKLL